MATGLEPSAEQTATSLVTGILGDLQNLVEQQFLLIRREVERDVRQAVRAGSLLAAGGLVLFLGGFSFCLAAAGWLHWMTGGVDAASIPLWGCHAIVSLTLFILGGALLLGGQRQFKNIKPLESPAAEALKENVEWTTNAPLK